ncbi:Serine/threonine-protein kinase PknD [Streptomyces sp. RB5]|uniref:Serine/threonine-protein kinase PknD n=1 Tax=Streptomyces smaragdinus TaxID=2585196 RepID=A0A7K0CDP2_9ACTN|nr:serine/threonine-protein kinase [Streptomyces smaragdinus]MQY11570.1 Serine/threonine-protein kinase PknD [Streptomyces smaragdinus]
MGDRAGVFQALQGDDPRQIGGYRLAARLGAGGMGRVYLSHTRGGRPVALKVVRPELADDPSFLRRFRREVKAARRVRGAYTAEVVDADPEGTPPWLATLYVPGPSLADAVAAKGPLPVPAVLWLMAGVAEALQVIHAEGIVHRDLKPSNVLLAADGPRVIDFGISLASGITADTATGTAVGTPAYMAPEQAEAGDVTAASDVFALGQTAAFAALGRPLYGDGPSVGVLYRIIHSRPDLTPLPEQLRPLLARCLAAEPADRATPAEIVEWCRRHLGADTDGGPAVWGEIAGTPTTPPPPVPDPTLVRTSPFLLAPPPPLPVRPDRRRRALIAGVVTAATAVGLVLVTTTFGDAVDTMRGWGAAPSSPSLSPLPPYSGPPPSATTADDRTSSPTPTTSPSPTPGPTKAYPHPFIMLDGTNSVSLGGTIEHKDRKGDIRFVCGSYECRLESDTSKLALMVGEPGADLGTCRDATWGERTLPLNSTATGSEICVQHRSGVIALLVVKSKQAEPQYGSNFLAADLTVWHAS